MSTEKTYAQKRKEALEALGQYQKQGVIGDSVKSLGDMLMDESDRGVVVILGSLIEDALLLRLMASFIGLSATEQKNLTRGGGLLSNFDHRINLAHALGLIDTDTVDSLQIIKAMRNACAHSRRNIDFKTPELQEVLCLLFDDDSADVIRASKLTAFVRICFIAQFIALLGLVRGKTPAAAVNAAQSVFDDILEESKRLEQKRAASQKKRKKQPAKRPRKNPTD